MLKWQKTFVFFLMALGLFFLDQAGFFDSSLNLAHRLIIKPITNSIVYLGEEGNFLFKNIFGVRGLINENLFLKSQRDFFRGEYFKLLEVKEENQFLRQALSLGKENNKKLVLGNILSFDPFQAGDSLVIDKGGKNGIKVGDAVILSGHILVGSVKEVKDKESRVLLITSAQSRVTVVSEDSIIKGVISGSASGALSLDLVLKEARLKYGQVLVSSGLDAVFPRGLLVGEVGSIVSDNSVPFQKASVRPFFNLRDLKQVFIVISD